MYMTFSTVLCFVNLIVILKKVLCVYERMICLLKCFDFSDRKYFIIKSYSFMTCHCFYIFLNTVHLRLSFDWTEFLLIWSYCGYTQSITQHQVGVIAQRGVLIMWLDIKKGSRMIIRPACTDRCGRAILFVIRFKVNRWNVFKCWN
jgi:hypothetical protein